MRAATTLPITVKTRIGIDTRDSYAELADFTEKVAAGGCEIFILHARKAWLKGLSPKENREIPPLRYDVVYRLKQDFPALTLIINGGLTSLDQVAAQLGPVDGAMIGRAAYENPYLLAEADQRLFGSTEPPLTRHQVIQAFRPYLETQLQQGTPLHGLTRHILGLFQGVPGAPNIVVRAHPARHVHAIKGELDSLQDGIGALPDARRVSRHRLAGRDRAGSRLWKLHHATSFEAARRRIAGAVSPSWM